MFGHLLHYTAEDVDNLTVERFEVLTAWIDEHQAQARKAASANG